MIAQEAIERSLSGNAFVAMAARWQEMDAVKEEAKVSHPEHYCQT